MVAEGRETGAVPAVREVRRPLGAVAAASIVFVVFVFVVLVLAGNNGQRALTDARET